MKQYDMIVIGTGSGNIILEAAQKAGKKCAQIERGKFGGTCLTRGCIPTKVLVTAADRLYEVREAGKLGIETVEPAVNWQTITSRVWQKIDESKGLRQFYLDEPHTDVYEGTAHFLEDHVVEVHYPDGRVSEPLIAPKIFITTGSRTKLPAMEGLEDIDYMTSERFFGPQWPQTPYKDVIIVGGGAIGCEFAHIFRAFGARVQLVQHNVRLLPKGDSELSRAIAQLLSADGIELYFNKETPRVRKDGDRVILTVQDRADGSLTDLSCQTLFICPGIVPATDGLGLENTSVQTDARGWIRTNEYLETSADGVYASGDINGLFPFRHKANYEADILAHNHFMSSSPFEWRAARYDLVPQVTYSRFEAADVGMTEDQARKVFPDVVVAHNAYADTAKGFALGFDPDSRHLAFAKLILKKDGTILGMHAIGPFASTLIQPYLELMSASKKKAPVINADIGSKAVQGLRRNEMWHIYPPSNIKAVRYTMVPHPSLSEVGIWTYYDLEAKGWKF
jgi:mycothione reductase